MYKLLPLIWFILLLPLLARADSLILAQSTMLATGRAELFLKAIKTTADTCFAEYAELKLIGQAGQIIHVTGHSVPLEGLAIVRVDTAGTDYLLLQAYARLTYLRPPDVRYNLQIFPVTSELPFQALLMDKERSTSSLPFFDLSHLPTTDAGQLARELHHAGGSYASGPFPPDHPFRREPFLTMPEQSGLIDIQPALIHVLSWFWQDSVAEDYVNLNVELRSTDGDARPSLLRLNQAQWQAFRTAFLSTSQGWSGLIAWIRQALSGREGFLDYALETLESFCPSSADEEQFSEAFAQQTEAFAQQIDAVLQQSGHEFSLTFELDLFDDHLGILQSGRRSKQPSQPQPKKHAASRQYKSSGSSSGRSLKRRRNQGSDGAGNSGDEDPGDHSPPSKREKTADLQTTTESTLVKVLRNEIIRRKILSCLLDRNTGNTLRTLRIAGNRELTVLMDLALAERVNLFPALAGTDTAMEDLNFTHCHEALEWLEKRNKKHFALRKKPPENSESLYHYVRLWVDDAYRQLTKAKYRISRSENLNASGGSISQVILGRDDNILIMISDLQVDMFCRSSRGQWDTRHLLYKKELYKKELYKGKLRKEKNDTLFLSSDGQFLAFMDSGDQIRILTLCPKSGVTAQAAIARSELIKPGFGIANSLFVCGEEDVCVWSPARVIREVEAENWGMVNRLTKPADARLVLSFCGEVLAMAAVVGGNPLVKLFHFNTPSQFQEHSIQEDNHTGFVADLAFSDNSQMCFVLFDSESPEENRLQDWLQRWLLVLQKQSDGWQQLTKVTLADCDHLKSILPSPDGQCVALNILRGKDDHCLKLVCPDGNKSWESDRYYINGDDDATVKLQCHFSPDSRFLAIDWTINSLSRTYDTAHQCQIYSDKKTQLKMSSDAYPSEVVRPLWGRVSLLESDFENEISCFSPDRIHLAFLENNRLILHRVYWDGSRDKIIFSVIKEWEPVPGSQSGELPIKHEKVLRIFFDHEGKKLFLLTDQSLMVFDLLASDSE